jgi:5-methyltetrahydropteroyltriglutamate--homocysteine methyltransferase
MLWAPWRLEGEALVEANRDATLLALKEQEDAGIDIVTIVDTIADVRCGDKVALPMGFAALLNEETGELTEIVVDVVQFDEPAFNVYTEKVTDWGIAALRRAAEDMAWKNSRPYLLWLLWLRHQANIDWKSSLGAEWR